MKANYKVINNKQVQLRKVIEGFKPDDVASVILFRYNVMQALTSLNDDCTDFEEADMKETATDLTEFFEDAVNEGIRQGYIEGYLRKSVVSDPILRENTKDNTPGVIHYEIIAGENIEITVAPKGFGSENMSRVCMLKPADGIEGVKNAVIETVKIAGPNACPPVVVGVGVGGTFEKCAILAKKALTRDLNTHNEISYVADLEKELLEKINKLEIGPGGLGGKMTALGVNVEVYPTHIAGLPVAINMCCHVNRHVHRII